MDENLRVDVQVRGANSTTDFRDLSREVVGLARQKVVECWRVALAAEGVELGERELDGTNYPITNRPGIEALFSHTLATITFINEESATTGSYTAKAAAAKLRRLLPSAPRVEENTGR